ESGEPVESPEDDATVPTTQEAAALELVKTVVGVDDVNVNGLNDEGDIMNDEFEVTAPASNNVDISNLDSNDDLISSVDISCLATTLAPGESTTCSASYTITAADVLAGSVNNTATASGETESGEPVESPEDDATVPTTQEAAALELVKAVVGVDDVNVNGLNDEGD